MCKLFQQNFGCILLLFGTLCDDMNIHHGPNWEAHQAKKAAREAAKTARLGSVASGRINQEDPFAAIDNSVLRDIGL